MEIEVGFKFKSFDYPNYYAEIVEINELENWILVQWFLNGESYDSVIKVKKDSFISKFEYYGYSKISKLEEELL